MRKNKSKRWLSVPAACALVVLTSAALSAPAPADAPARPANKPRDFDGITCQTNIAQAMIGRRLSNEAVSKTQRRYKELGLDVGSFGLDEDTDLWFEEWTVCGREYATLVLKNVVVDVLPPLPPGDQREHAIGVECVIDGVKRDATVLGVLDPEPGAANEKGGVVEQTRAMTQAWLIDAKALKFKKIEAKSIVCDFL